MFKRLTELWLAWRALTSRKLRLPQKGEKWEMKTCQKHGQPSEFPYSMEYPMTVGWEWGDEKPSPLQLEMIQCGCFYKK